MKKPENRGAGDPEGKRIARRQSVAAEEAFRLAECLAKAMRRCGLSDDEAKRLTLDLRQHSVALLEKAEGRIISRLTTRNTGHPLLEARAIDCLFFDESGTAAINPNESTFALGGVSMRESDIPTYVREANSLKRHFFGKTDVVFHEPMMRKHENYFSFGGSRTRQADFEKAFRELVENTPFTVFATGIRKDEFKRLFLDPGTDAYLPKGVYELAIALTLERYVDYLATDTDRGHVRHVGRVHLESIGKREDAEHQAAYTDLMLYGTQFVPESSFQSWIEAGCRFSTKGQSNPAELADLVARDVFEWTRSNCKVAPPYWDLISGRLHARDDGSFGKFSLKVFPAEGAEDGIETHRAACLAGQKN